MPALEIWTSQQNCSLADVYMGNRSNVKGVGYLIWCVIAAG